MRTANSERVQLGDYIFDFIPAIQASLEALKDQERSRKSAEPTSDARKLALNPWTSSRSSGSLLPRRPGAVSAVQHLIVLD